MREALKAALESAHSQIREAHAAIAGDRADRAQAHALIAIAEMMHALTQDVLDDEKAGEIPGE